MTDRPTRSTPPTLHRIVIVGGGAGGLELATLLGDRLGKTHHAQITLIDKKRTHFWKPHLHEIAAGNVNLGMHELSYMAQAHWHSFTDRVGEMTGLDRTRRVVPIAPHLDEDGEQVTPVREIPYDTLVLAVGSQTNCFGTPGAREHAIFLDTPEEAQRFHRKLVNAMIRAQSVVDRLEPHHLQVAIVGGGATGVELAAELRHACKQVLRYGLRQLQGLTIGVHLVEANGRILTALAPRIADRALQQLCSLSIRVHVEARVARVPG